MTVVKSPFFRSARILDALTTRLLPETVAMMARMKPMTAAKMVDDRNAQISEMMPRMIERAPLGFC